jgi:hypothetical protein
VPKSRFFPICEHERTPLGRDSTLHGVVFHKM